MPDGMKRYLPLLLALACQRPEAPTTEAPATDFAALATRAGAIPSVGTNDVPRFLWGTSAIEKPPTDDAATAALAYVERFAPTLNLRDLEAIEVRAVHRLPRIGTIVKLGQRYAGVEVYPSELRLLLRDDLSLVALAGAVSPVGAKAPRFDLSPESALAIALGDATGSLVPASAMSAARAGSDDFVYFEARTDDVHLPEPARVKPVWFADGRTLAPAYFVEAYAGRPDGVEHVAFAHVIDARDGKILEREDLTSADSFDYRVFADPISARPLDGPHTDFSPHPTGAPDGSMPTPIPPNLVTMESFNTPPGGGVDPWLPAGATEATGNNVDCYADITAPSGFNAGDLRATTTSPGVFDRTFDTTQDPVATEAQSMAAVTNAFYITNWLHDYWYDSGFDEAAGNAQVDNYGRGGLGGDVLRIEVQDYSGRNNANMSTPGDGMSPRMQVYVWSGNQQPSLTLVGAPSPTSVGTASFGPQNFDVTGTVVAGDDGVGTGTDACEPLVNNVAGQIALVDRGGCTFILKVQNAENAGAIGVILANNRGGGAPGMGGGGNTNTPVLSVSDVDGAAIRTALAGGPVTATLFRMVAPDLDGALDVGLVSHEWGHYIHRRLTSCGNTQCSAMSEGWGDILDWFTKIREGDDLNGAYGHTVYAASGRANGAYFGTRRTAYSINPAINAQSFRHIQDGEPDPVGQPFDPGNPNSEIHNAGEIWSSMLFEVYAELLSQVGPAPAPSFEDIRRRFADYVVAGLMLTPRAATYIEGRDAILAAAAASSPQDLGAIAAAFGRRGAGTCAEGPPVDSTDLVGVVEDTGVSARILVGGITIDDGLYSCDGDGVLDAEERGRVTFTVSNGGPIAMQGATVTLTSSTAGVTFPDGATVALPAIDPYQTASVEIAVNVDPTLTQTGAMHLLTTVAAPDTCLLSQTSTTITLVNLDSAVGSTSDDVEAPTSAWTPTGDQASEIWSRLEATGGYAWRGEDFGAPSDTSLESPPLVVSSTVAFVVSFDHRFSFERRSEDFDGGMIEISIDGGRNWTDVSTYVAPGYNGTLGTNSNNPLGGRACFAGTNGAWPDRERLVLDFGSQLAGRTVQLRFRIGTDAAVSDFGWELDDFTVSGIDNAPFTALRPDGTTCLPELVADAGGDQEVEAFTAVLLDGTGSASNAGRPITFRWAQTAGPTVALSRSDTNLAAFSAPNLGQDTTLTFELTVDDGVLAATDTVDVRVLAGSFTALVADAGMDRTVAPGEVVRLDASASRGEGTLSYTWAQLDGPEITLLDADGVVAVFVAPELDAEATARFQVQVEDDVSSAVDAVQITIGAAGAIVADAGADQSVEGGQIVTLDGSGSSGATAFLWEQVSGTAAEIGSGAGERLVFVAPDVDEALVFRLTASNGARAATDEVTITAMKAPVGELPEVDDSGCSCAATQRSGRGWSWVFLPLLFVGYFFRGRGTP